MISRFYRTTIVAFSLAILSVVTPRQASAQDAADKLVVIKATYGDLSPGGKTADVTKKVADMVKDNALSVDATNENFDDPAQGTVKGLRVNYTVGGVAGAKVVNEHETLTLTKGEKPPVITKATYGEQDVTDKVKKMVSEGELAIEASKDNFGGAAAGSAGSAAKKLRVDFTINSKPYSKTADENVILLIGPVVAQSGDLIIRRAHYGDAGANAKQIDVTDLIAAKVKNGAVTFEINDAALGNLGDPADSGKRLEVLYTIKGVEKTKNFPQDETLKLPE